MLKRIAAMILSAIMLLCIGLSAYAEESSTPPEMPSGGMAPPDWENGQPPEKPDGSVAPPDGGNGQPPAKSDGNGPGGPGGAPGGQQGSVEGQLGSWSMGGTDADSEGGNDYAYDVALYVTADGISQDAFDNAEEAAAFAAQYQNTSFTINEYWSIGQVANLVNSNGANAINITLTDDAVWNVTNTSLITSLTINGSAKVIVPAGITLTVGDTTYTDCVLTAD